jgi:ribokinase
MGATFFLNYFSVIDIPSDLYLNRPMKKPSILVIGSINIDLVGTGARLPGPGETLNGTAFSKTFGGKGANQAAAAAKAGADVQLLGAVGDDDFGRSALEAQRSYGVNTDRCKTTAGTSTGVALIMIGGQEAENSILIVPGANGEISPADLNGIDWPAYDAVMLQLEIPFQTVEAAIRAASPHTKIILTPAPAVALSGDLLRKVDVLIPNEHEICIAAGTTDVDSAVKHVSGLVREGVALTLGAKGVRWVSRTEDFTLPAFPGEPVDTVGAGDCFSGYFAAACAAGQPIRDCLTFATAAAALKIQRRGAQTGIPDRSEVDAVLTETL